MDAHLAADPLNLSGVISDRPASRRCTKRAGLQNGRCIAAKIAGRIEFLADVDPAEQCSFARACRSAASSGPAAVPASVPEPHFMRPGKKREPDHTQLNSRRRFGL